MQRLVFHSILAVVAMLVIAKLIAPAAPSTEPKSESQALSPVEPETGKISDFYSDETVIRRDPTGQFRLTAQVNGQDTPFLIDTGADIVALTVDDAARLGLDVRPDDFHPIMQTASGIGNGARVQLDRVELGGQEFRDVSAVVVEGLTVNLLGQSVLRRLGKVELQGDRMIIRHS